MVREEMLQMRKGNGLVRLLYCKFKTSNDDMLQLVRVDGIAPVRWLLCRCVSRRFQQLCKVGGTLSSNKLYDSWSILKRCKRLIS
jgi:hypothetical protein